MHSLPPDPQAPELSETLRCAFVKIRYSSQNLQNNKSSIPGLHILQMCHSTPASVRRPSRWRLNHILVFTHAFQIFADCFWASLEDTILVDHLQ